MPSATLSGALIGFGVEKYINTFRKPQSGPESYAAMMVIGAVTANCVVKWDGNAQRRKEREKIRFRSHYCPWCNEMCAGCRSGGRVGRGIPTLHNQHNEVEDQGSPTVHDQHNKIEDQESPPAVHDKIEDGSRSSGCEGQAGSPAVDDQHNES
ncbi:uncharacterized protein LOC130987827 [Salvia miltiorrhiza]|uniref:uncharacterized protein LOC130987827 n=1 Tax=Salvia miltiorrhiza TaxID=226208 RepID=UPI0025AC5107|nr:uncharacterized protein LOC130987827 [Salvia miltiorrhiza]